MRCKITARSWQRPGTACWSHGTRSSWNFEKIFRKSFFGLLITNNFLFAKLILKAKKKQNGTSGVLLKPYEFMWKILKSKQFLAMGINVNLKKAIMNYVVKLELRALLSINVETQTGYLCWQFWHKCHGLILSTLLVFFEFWH